MNPIKSFFSSVVGALIGLALFVGSFPLHLWNERRAVKTERSLAEGQKTFVKADAAQLDRTQDGKLVYLSGEAKAAELLTDPATHLRVPALVLERHSEMYQWDESSKKSGNNDRTYTYDRRWKSGLENSSNFHDQTGHRNPDRYVFPSGSTTVPQAALGAFRVPAAILQKLDANMPWLPEQKQLAELPAEVRSRAQISDGQLFLGKSPAAPEIGDERVKFSIVPPGAISVLARQVGDSLAEHATSNGYTIALAEAGTVAPDVMFQHAFSANRVLTWVLRGLGTFLMFLGARLIIEPLTKITDWIPLFGGLIDAGATLASGLLAIVLSAVTVALSWFVVRPLLSIGLFAAAGALLWFAKRGRSSGVSSQPPPPPPLSA